MPRNILIIEDDTDIAQLVKLQLEDIDCNSVTVDNGLAAIEHLRENAHYDLLILDLMLPGCDGLSICRQVRSGNQHTPILMLTAKSSELDRVLGLEMGADDYLVKPFSFLELSARVKALFRRSKTIAQRDKNGQQRISIGDLRINLETRRVTIAGKVVELTVREFDLLLHFARHPEHVFTRSQLLDQVWGYCHDGYEHTVNTHINRLRSKIETRPDAPRYITTVWGVGYQFNQSHRRLPAREALADAV